MPGIYNTSIPALTWLPISASQSEPGRCSYKILLNQYRSEQHSSQVWRVSPSGLRADFVWRSLLHYSLECAWDCAERALVEYAGARAESVQYRDQNGKLTWVVPEVERSAEEFDGAGEAAVEQWKHDIARVMEGRESDDSTTLVGDRDSDGSATLVGEAQGGELQASDPSTTDEAAERTSELRLAYEHALATGMDIDQAIEGLERAMVEGLEPDCGADEVDQFMEEMFRG